jgi:hypothetical protein
LHRPSLVGLSDDATVFAVDNASVRLEPQTFGGIAGAPLCLVLRARIGVDDGNLLAITYQVNILSDAGAGLIDLPKLDPFVKPIV